MNTKKNQRVIIHACGGCGVTITKKEIEELREDGLLNVEIKYIDTSTADIAELNIDNKDVYLIKNAKLNKNVDGSGGKRAALDSHITEGMKDYIEKLDTVKEDIHIVVSSASGGSGSLIGPRLIHNLKSSGAAAIYITITDTSSVEYCINTIDTLKHIDIMGRKYGYTIPTLPIDNADSIAIVNKRVGVTVDLLSILFSAKHKSLDTADMLLFANNGYDTDAAGLVSLSIYDDANINKLKDSFISTLRILTTDEYFKVDTEVLSKIRQYKIGHITPDLLERLDNSKYSHPIYFAITRNNVVDKIMAIKYELEEKLKINEDKREVFDMSDDVNGISI